MIKDVIDWIEGTNHFVIEKVETKILDVGEIMGTTVMSKESNSPKKWLGNLLKKVLHLKRLKRTVLIDMQWADMDSDEEAISQNGVKKMELNPREHGKVKKKL